MNLYTLVYLFPELMQLQKFNPENDLEVSTMFQELCQPWEYVKKKWRL